MALKTTFTKPDEVFPPKYKKAPVAGGCVSKPSGDAPQTMRCFSGSFLAVIKMGQGLIQWAKPKMARQNGPTPAKARLRFCCKPAKRFAGARAPGQTGLPAAMAIAYPAAKGLCHKPGYWGGVARALRLYNWL